jgi:hypothetical protein
MTLQFAVGNPGEPEVPVHTERAVHIVPGTSVWDGHDRCFYCVDATPAHPMPGWVTLVYSDGSINDYESWVRLQVANSPSAAEAFNRWRAGERAA